MDLTHPEEREQNSLTPFSDSASACVIIPSLRLETSLLTLPLLSLSFL